MTELRVPLIITEYPDGTAVVQLHTPYIWSLSRDDSRVSMREASAWTNNDEEIAWLINHLKSQIGSKD